VIGAPSSGVDRDPTKPGADSTSGTPQIAASTHGEDGVDMAIERESEVSARRRRYAGAPERRM